MKTPGGHNIDFDQSFNCFTLLNKDVVCDFIDMFYAYDDQTDVKWIITAETKSDFHGQHMFNPNTREHYIRLNEKNIRDSFTKGLRRFGGNLNLPDIDLMLAAGLVLAHELQHANQSKFHAKDKNFYGYLGGFTANGKPRMKQYKGRPCERDARAFVDEHLNEVFAYFNRDTPRRSKAAVVDDTTEVDAVVDLLLECDEVNMDDVRDELRSSKILNFKNVQKVISALREHGMQI